VTLNANPVSGWMFDHWSGDASGSNPSVTITMNSHKSVTAYFTEIQPGITSAPAPTCSHTGQLSNADLANLVLRHFPDGIVTQTGENIRVTAYAVARAESGGNPFTCGDNGQSIGIWQINMPSHPQYSRECLFDADCNADAAKAISNNGLDWNAWCTWEKSACNGNGNNNYKAYIDEAKDALGIISASEACPGQGATNLTNYYSAWGKALPSLNERAKIYQAVGLGFASSYGGTAEQNELLLDALKQWCICPSTVEDILKQYAPTLMFSRGESYLPTGVHRYYAGEFNTGPYGDDLIVQNNHENYDSGAFPSTPICYYNTTKYDNFVVYQYWYYYAFNRWLNCHEHDFEVAFVWIHTETGQPFYYALSRHLWVNEYDVSDTTELSAYVEKGGHGMVKDYRNDTADWFKFTYEEGGLTVPGRNFTFIPVELLETYSGTDLSEEYKYKSNEYYIKSTCIGCSLCKEPIEEVEAPLFRAVYKNPQQIYTQPGRKGGPTNIIWAEVFSPVELRVYDSQGQVTGIVDGEIVVGIPNSNYYDGAVIIFDPFDSYTYEIVGKDEGSYGVSVTKATDQEPISFMVTDAPTSANAVHEYTIDWDTLSHNGQGVTLQLDSDGDGTFEQTKYLSAIGEEEKGLPIWIWPTVVFAAALMVLAVALIFRNTARRQRVRVKSTQKAASFIRCPACDAKNRLGARFCLKCGAPLVEE